ncbi:DUF3592 domain-containing protein [Candidatus Saccharibacteria bacterium]|nr:DUF3592 domain-containing protein [Candidatus Saccharibacteria bacterium]
MEKFKNFIPALVGLVLIGAAVFMYFRANYLTRVCTEPTTATVVDMREDYTTDSDGAFRYVYYPVIEYQAGGQTLTEELDSGSTTPAYRLGETVDILYNPANAKEFIVAGSNQNLIWILLSALGVIFLGVGVYTIVKK